MLVALALIAMLILSIVRRPGYAWAAVLVLLVGADVARVRTVPSSDYSITPSAQVISATCRYGVVRLDVNTNALSAAEKPAAYGVKIYEARSIFRRIAARTISGCTS